MSEPILFLLLGCVSVVILIVGRITHAQEQRQSQQRRQYFHLKHQADSTQMVLSQLRNIDPLPALHLNLTEYLLTRLTGLRLLGINTASVDAQIMEARRLRDLINQGGLKAADNASDLDQVMKIRKLYQKVAGILKNANGAGALEAENYDRLIIHINWQYLRVEADYYFTKAEDAMKSDDTFVARSALSHARRLLANSHIDHPDRQEKLAVINELLGSLHKPGNKLLAGLEADDLPSETPANLVGNELVRQQRLY